MNKFLRLHQELHSRPLPEVNVGATIIHLAYLRGGTVEREKAHLRRLAKLVSAEMTTSGDSHCLLAMGGCRLRVEFHTEFTEYSFTKEVPSRFQDPLHLDMIPHEWIEKIPGDNINRIGIIVENVSEPPPPLEMSEQLGVETIVGSDVSDSALRVWTDFRVGPHGFTRFMLHARTQDAARVGRAVQRIIDIENYRMLAFIGLRKTRQLATPMMQVESRLEVLMRDFGDIASMRDEKSTLNELTHLSAEVELMKAHSMNRFRATDAYSEIMRDRLDELRETKIEGCQTLSGYLLRRSAPAFRTCKATKDRILDLSLRISRAAELLRTRIDVQLEEQNQQLLQSVDRRASLQNRLQLTIEWFSVFAITVYVLQLFKIVLDTVNQLVVPFNSQIVLGISTPITFLLIAILIGLIRRQYRECR